MALFQTPHFTIYRADCFQTKCTTGLTMQIQSGAEPWLWHGCFLMVPAARPVLQVRWHFKQSTYCIKRILKCGSKLFSTCTETSETPALVAIKYTAAPKSECTKVQIAICMYSKPSSPENLHTGNSYQYCNCTHVRTAFLHTHFQKH